MRFPNAAKGVSRIFLAEILALIASVVMFIATFMGILTFAANETGAANGVIGAGIGMLGFLTAAGFLGIISFILNIVGIVNASKDEESFRSALMCTVVGIIVSVIGSIFSANVFVYDICGIISRLMSLIVTVLVILGIIRLADRLHNAAVSANGRMQLKLIVAIYCVSIIASIVVAFLGGQAASTVAGIVAIVSAVLSIVQYILYLIFLSKAKKMLENS